MVLLAHYAAADTETLEPPLHARFNLAETVEWLHGCVFEYQFGQVQFASSGRSVPCSCA